MPLPTLPPLTEVLPRAQHLYFQDVRQQVLDAVKPTGFARDIHVQSVNRGR